MAQISEHINRKIGHSIIEKGSNAKKYLLDLIKTEEKTVETVIYEMIDQNLDLLDKKFVKKEVRKNKSLFEHRTEKNIEINEKHSALFIYLISSKKLWELNNELNDIKNSLGKVKNRKKAQKLLKKERKLLKIIFFLKKDYNLKDLTDLTIEDLAIAFEDSEIEEDLLSNKSYYSTIEKNKEDKIWSDLTDGNDRGDYDYEKMKEKLNKRFKEKMNVIERVEKRNKEIKEEIEIIRNIIDEAARIKNDLK